MGTKDSLFPDAVRERKFETTDDYFISVSIPSEYVCLHGSENILYELAFCTVSVPNIKLWSKIHLSSEPYHQPLK